MAIIPKKTKTSIASDNGIGIELCLLIFTSVYFTDRFLGDKVHAYMTPLLYLLMIVVVAYMVLPSHKNKGKTGYESMMIFLHYKISQIKNRRAKAK